MTDGIIGTALNVLGEKEYKNRSKELRAIATLLEKAADTVDECCNEADSKEYVNTLQYKILEKERGDLAKELEEWKEKYKNLYEDYVFVCDKIKVLEATEKKGEEDG